MSAAPSIRPVRAEDLEALAELCREHSRYERAARLAPAAPKALQALFLTEPARAQCWVAVDGQTPIGFAVGSLEVSAWDAGLYYHMDCLFLRDTHRGQGLGKQLMQAVGAEALRRNAINLQWQTPEWNEDAIRFYDRLGGTSSRKLRYTVQPEVLKRWAATNPLEPGPR